MSGRSGRETTLTFVVALGGVRVVVGLSERGVIERDEFGGFVALGGVRMW